MPASVSIPPTLAWLGGTDGHLRLLDQTLLPARVEFRDCQTIEQLWDAIKKLQVRGAPAIGVAAAFGVVLGLRQPFEHSWEGAFHQVRRIGSYLRTSRPTAVNLCWALARMEQVATQVEGAFDARRYREGLLTEARAIQEEDRQTCRAIGAAGADLIRDGDGLLTHCNTGALATAGDGTAAAVIYEAVNRSRKVSVFVGETRPLLQGARLTTWELRQRGIPCTLICDSMAGQVMKEGKVQLVLVGADRIAANGDTANKIGTYSLALLAKAHEIPFYVAAPTSTFDLSIATGSDIPIEERDPHEITHGFGNQTAAEGIGVYNPAFDVTPAALIAALITEKGLIRPVDVATISKVVSQ
jgi:methylthioribose-1-phosphate isomerase